jgi:hypothetical protein
MDAHDKNVKVESGQAVTQASVHSLAALVGACVVTANGGQWQTAAPRLSYAAWSGYSLTWAGLG